jgi:hypothetical protein
MSDTVTGELPMSDSPRTVYEFAAATSSKKSMSGIPTTVIPDVDEPTLTMWETMMKRGIEPSAYMREEAAQDDVFMILSGIWRACMIGSWNIVAKDMDTSADTIKEMRTWMKDVELMKAFTGGQINSNNPGALYNYQVAGKYAIYGYRDGNAGGGKIDKFVNIPVDGLRKFTHPTNPSRYYFFQKFKKEADWTDPDQWDKVETPKDKGDVKSEEQRIWYIEGGEKNRETKDKDTGTLMYPNIKPMDWVNNLEDLYYVENPTPPLNANVITTIMNKRYLVQMTIVAVQLGIVPFIKIIHGNDDIRPPPAPDEKIKSVNATEYAKQETMFNSFKTNMQETADTVHVAIMNGKPISIQYGIEVNRDEPHMALTSDFMEKVIGIYNNIIARAVGLPLSLIESSGTELATSQVVKSQNDISLMASQIMFKDVLMHLLAIQFEKEIDEKEITIELQPLDRASSKTRAEIQTLLANAALSLYHAGASPDTLANFILANVDVPLQKADMTAVHDSIPKTVTDPLGNEEDVTEPLPKEDDDV